MDETIKIELTIEEALNLSTLLNLTRSVCAEHILTGPALDTFAYALLNSAMDPIISQLDEGLELLGLN